MFPDHLILPWTPWSSGHNLRLPPGRSRVQSPLNPRLTSTSFITSSSSSSAFSSISLQNIPWNIANTPLRISHKCTRTRKRWGKDITRSDKRRLIDFHYIITIRSPESSGLRSEAVVGRTFSLADRETKKANGTSQRNRVKYAIT